MAERYEEVLALLAKVEAVEQTDAVPTAAEAMLAKNVTFEPMLGTRIRRGLLKPYHGHQGIIFAGHHMKLTFDIEMAGSGTAGTAPAYGPLMKATKHAETVVEEESVPVAVEYTPISRLMESATLYYFLDGRRHIMVGCRGKLSVPQMQGLALPHFRFEMTGIAGTITDQAMPDVDTALEDFVDPEPVGAGNTTLSLHGVSFPAESLALDFGAQVETRFLVNSQGVKQVGHEATGTVVLQADTIAAKDWPGVIKAETLGALAFQHGTTAGNIVEIGADAVQIEDLRYGGTQKILNDQLSLILRPTSGNDDYVITVK